VYPCGARKATVRRSRRPDAVPVAAWLSGKTPSVDRFRSIM